MSRAPNRGDPARHALLLVLTAILACADPPAPEAEGLWGGPVASLSLSRAGGALAYSCGAGTIDSMWTLSREGRFTATGKHFFGGGPVPPEGHPPHPARYTGRIDGSVMILTITVTDLVQTLGPFRLVRNGPVVRELCV